MNRAEAKEPPDRLTKHYPRSTVTRETDGATIDGSTPADYTFREVAELDDFQVIAERHQVSETIAALIDRHGKLNEEMTRRATLRWMLP